MVFYLARHGETQWNRLGLLQGQLESELTELGREQAKTLALSLLDKDITHIFSSSLSRAKETAEICAELITQPVSTLEHLVERHFGHLQGMSFDELKKDPKYDSLWTDSIAFEPEGGESADASAKRLLNSLTEIAARDVGSQILCVSHGDIIRNFLNRHLHKSNGQSVPLLSNGQWMAVSYCSKSDQFTLVQ